MTRTTRAQRESIFRKWDALRQSAKEHSQHTSLTYKQFRRSVLPTFGCDNAVTVQWCGMWLCIETDGYCHS